MRGISPVIATILLLLFAVAAVGATWLWLNRQQSVVQSAGEEQLSQEIERQTASQVVLSGVYASGSNLALLISNPSKSAATVTGYKITKPDGSSVVTTTASVSVPAGSTVSHVTSYTVSSLCSSGQTIKIQLFVNGMSTPEFVEDCPA